MIPIFLSACVLAALTVAVHATGIAVLLRGLLRLHPQPTGVWPVARLLLRMIWWLVLLHLAEILIWGLFYLWRGCMPNTEAAFLLFRSHLHDRWIWRSGAGEVVAAARTDRELDGRPHVRLVHGLLLRRREPHPSIATREIHRRFHYR